ncbi:bis(5'-nucleosyl)-tetraphosphatase (symmetrical) YqeK [Jeotgalibaca ciconiae]|uniref:bis(5'-nucleosyl)-tetraphosphatase (symmetrical) n=1 Tax=Jeotgalibaca ciconiae TaxID=2496265 RepID=A0A3S9HCF9_9LACT|nr:bis(5'-nucleosyl)-tetraphosphatase (symmetrical) YqeK [Jeotgalibaca ciconiae]AZP05075.1 HD domain-containing protein [Jeotgalibaca ciconiae]HJB23964.1 bis(5'-nucleosyl)-tetraphosphatase (symmetrical) YqeK [Candidatus Jeotgalibaca pullicola]
MNDKNMLYSNHYTGWSREAILKEVQTKITPARYEHILRVESCAIALAEKYGADKEACSLAAILHDYAKDVDKDTIKRLVDNGDLQAELLEYGSQIWHGPAGSYYAEKTFGIVDAAILSAISQHTIGGREMTLLSKILFIADYVEEGRTFPGVEEARELAFEDLNQAVIYKITQTLIHLVQKRVKIYPETLFVYNAWINK